MVGYQGQSSLLSSQRNPARRMWPTRWALPRARQMGDCRIHCHHQVEIFHDGRRVENCASLSRRSPRSTTANRPPKAAICSVPGPFCKLTSVTCGRHRRVPIGSTQTNDSGRLCARGCLARRFLFLMFCQNRRPDAVPRESLLASRARAGGQQLRKEPPRERWSAWCQAIPAGSTKAATGNEKKATPDRSELGHPLRVQPSGVGPAPADFQRLPWPPYSSPGPDSG